ncbi:MAG: DoxX family protein [Bacteroidetes bacterium]|nr:DoxX family protein [Bacteroidota bacterium]
MRRIFSTGYTETAFNLATFVLRVACGLLLCLNYGIMKLTHFSEMQHTFFDPLHVGHKWSLILTIVLEIFAAILVVLGLFTRIAAFLLVVEMGIIIFLLHHSQSFDHQENAILFLAGFFVILMVGPGRFSVDAMAGK